MELFSALVEKNTTP